MRTRLKNAADGICLVICLLLSAIAIFIVIVPSVSVVPNKYDARESIYRNAEQNGAAEFLVCPRCDSLVKRPRPSCPNCGKSVF